MYHIVKTKSKKFQVVLVGKNGEPLSTSETFSRKERAFKNVSAQASVIDDGWFICQDDTTFKVWKVYAGGNKEEAGHIDPSPKYIPGKNPKKKK